MPITTKKNRPAAQSPNVDHQVEQGQEQQAPACAVEHERTRPQVLVDRKIAVPQLRQAEASQADERHRRCLEVAAAAIVFQKLACEGSGQGGADRGNRAEQSLGVPIAAVEMTGDQQAIDVVRKRVAWGEIAGAEAGNGDELQRRPISDQQTRNPGQPAAPIRVQHDDPGKQVGQANATQDAR